MYVSELRCINCEKKYPWMGSSMLYTCVDCGGNLEILYDYTAISKVISKESLSRDNDFSLWRYRPFYPISPSTETSPLQVGWTPLYNSKILAKKLGIKSLYIKDEGRNPSASFKDRAGSIALCAAIERNMLNITGASTGNAGSSMACLCASMGISPVIFVPYKAPKAKIAQLLLYGARVLAVKGTYDEAFDLCLEVASHYGWFNRNTGYNPFTREGKKSCSFEICEQLGWNVPDWLFVSVGDGNIISGIWKGFKDLKETGLIDRLPKLCAVQSEKSNSVAKSFKNYRGGEIKIEPVSATTIADSISVDVPRDGISAVKAILESGGTAIEISDDEILSSIKLISKHTGVFAEPAGSASVAGLKELISRGVVKPEETAVCVITGNGLKDIESGLKSAGVPELIEPDLDSVIKLLDS